MDTKTVILGLLTFPLNCLYCLTQDCWCRDLVVSVVEDTIGFLAYQLRVVLMQFIKQTSIEHMSKFIIHERGQQIKSASLKW